MMNATYSPEDNKLRLYSSTRLDPETYARVKAHGFAWAPKQDLFVAPMWTPSRVDLLVELCGEIGDEDTSLVDRAEQRAERFDEYSDKRASDAERAHDSVKAIAENIPFGQPILVGHHSERHARRDAEKIENGMRKAVKMWETSQYWEQRAQGAIRNAKHKERPDVRARRIKGIEADLRKSQKTMKSAQAYLAGWSKLENGTAKKRDGSIATPHEIALYLSNSSYMSFSFTLEKYPRELPASQYEGPMGIWSALDGGVITALQARDLVVPAYERSIASCARWIEHYENRLTYERAMLAESGGTLADRTKPEVGGAIRSWYGMGKWSYIVKVNKVTVTILDAPTYGERVYRANVALDKIVGIMSAAEVNIAKQEGRVSEFGKGDKIVGFRLADLTPPEAPKPIEPSADAAKFAAMSETLKACVQVVAVNQLFPTPRDLAAQAVDLADIRPGHDVLEPSAGTGALLGAMGGQMFGHAPERGTVTAVEINSSLADRLRTEFPLTKVVAEDFLTMNGNLGMFDRIVMNPPFEKGADIRHIEHARKFLKPGGRLVAICANGPRQNERLKPIAAEWHDLPADTFKDQGTSVRTALLVIEATS